MATIKYDLRLTPKQNEEFREAAKKAGLTLASFLRAAATEKIQRMSMGQGKDIDNQVQTGTDGN